jgi:hypothetical protein
VGNIDNGLAAGAKVGNLMKEDFNFFVGDIDSSFSFVSGSK